MALELIAAEIAKLAFGAVIETGVGKVTEGVIVKLRQKIKDKLSKTPDAESAIAAAEQGSQSDLTRVAEYLQAVMKQDPIFAQEVQRLAGQISISSVADNRSVHRTSDRSNRTVEVKADTTGDIISDIKADSIGRIGGRDIHYH